MGTAPGASQTTGRRTQPLTGWVLRHPRQAIIATIALAAVSVLLAAGLRVPATQDLLVRRHSDVGRATSGLERTFGSEPIVIAFRGPLAATTLTPENVLALRDLERRLTGLAGVRSVYGPGTFFSSTISQFGRILAVTLGGPGQRAEVAAQQARRRALARGASSAQAYAVGERARLAALGPLQDEFSSLLVRFGSVGLPSLTNRNFLLTLVFGAGVHPKARFRQLFPDDDHAVIAVRLRAGLSDERVRDLGRQIAADVRSAGVRDTQATVGGSPLLTASIGSDLRVELRRLAPVVLAGMAVTLILALGGGLHILTLLAFGGLATALTAAADRLLGVGLSPGTLAALPVVFGLALDYAVQILVGLRHRRVEGQPRTEGLAATLRQVGPALRLAGMAMAVGFLTLLTSSAPLLRDLGITLVLGTLASLTLVLSVGAPLLALSDRRMGPPERRWRLRLPTQRTVSTRARRLLTPLVIGGLVAGLVLGARLSVESDPAKLGRGDSPELRGVQALQRELGTAGQLRIRVRARDVTRASVLRWMTDAQDRIIRANPVLRRGPDPAGLLAGDPGQAPDQAEVNRLLRLLPPYILDAVFSRDHHTAEISFGLPLISVDQQRRIVQRVDAVLRSAPAGIDAQPAGLVAAASSSVNSLSTARELLFPLAVLAVGLLLFAVRRRWDRALIPLLPALATAGFSGLLLAVTQVEPSALTVALEPLVLAVGVEFGVLLESSYQQFRTAGHPPNRAAALARERVGRAVATSAAAVAVGFAGLATSRLHVLAQFGSLAALEIVICATVAIMLVPAAMAARDRGPGNSPSLDPSTVQDPPYAGIR